MSSKSWQQAGLKVIGLYGGVEQDPQIAHLKNGVDVLVATPGRMFDLAHRSTQLCSSDPYPG